MSDRYLFRQIYTLNATEVQLKPVRGSARTHTHAHTTNLSYEYICRIFSRPCVSGMFHSAVNISGLVNSLPYGIACLPEFADGTGAGAKTTHPSSNISLTVK